MPKKIKDGDGNLIPERRKNNNKATYVVTWGAILLLATSIGWLITTRGQSEMRITKVEQNYTKVKEDISAIRTDIEWIKNTLSKKYQK